MSGSGGVRRGARGGAYSPEAPQAIPNLFAWWRADSGITIATGISAWMSKVGGHAITQAVAAQQPALVTLAALANKPAAYFDGGDLLASTESVGIWRFLSDGTGNTVFWVAVSDAVNSLGSIFSTIDPSGLTPGMWCRLTDARSQMEIYRTGAGDVLNTAGAGVPVVTGTGYVSDFSYSETTSPQLELRLGGVTKASGARTNPPETGDPNHTLAMGAISSAGSYLAGHIAEVILYNRVLATSEKDRVYNYLARRYGL